MLRVKWIALLAGLTIACHLGLLALGLSGSTNDAFWGFLWGAIFGQIALFAVWTAWGPARLHWRFPTGLLGAFLFCASLFYAFENLNAPRQEAYTLGLLFLVQWLFMQIPLWITRLGFRWRLAWPGEKSADGSRRELQFGIRQLFVWTAAVAILMGVCRVALPYVEHASRVNAVELVGFSILAAAHSLLAVPVFWAAFASGHLKLWWAIAGVCAVILTVAEMVAYYHWVFRADDVIYFFAIVNVVQFAATAVSLLMLRAAGFRLTQEAEAHSKER